MVTLKRRQRAEVEIPTVSMSDVSFLLLLFFLVTTTIDIDTGISITLPEYIPDEEQARTFLSKERIAALLVNENGDVFLDEKSISISEISKILKPRIISKVTLPDDEKLIVSIKTNRNTGYNYYIKALDQIMLAFQGARDEYSMAAYGKKYSGLDQAAGDKVREKIPVLISFAEPERAKRRN